MIHILLRITFNALGLMLIAYALPGIDVVSFWYAFIAAIVLGLLNLVVRPVLILLTIPLTILTLGLFAFVINGALFAFAAAVLEGFSVTNFWWAMLGALCMSVVSTIGSVWLKKG